MLPLRDYRTPNNNKDRIHTAVVSASILRVVIIYSAKTLILAPYKLFKYYSFIKAFHRLRALFSVGQDFTRTLVPIII